VFSRLHEITRYGGQRRSAKDSRREERHMGMEIEGMGRMGRNRRDEEDKLHRAEEKLNTANEEIARLQQNSAAAATKVIEGAKKGSVQVASPNGGLEFYFEIAAGGRTMLFAAETEEERTDWVDKKFGSLYCNSNEKTG